MTEKQLIQACCKRDRKAQRILYESYKDSLFMTCCKYSRNDTEAEDVFHDVFLTILDKIKTYKGKGSFEGWMKRIAIFKSIDHYKSRIEIPMEIQENQVIEPSNEVDLESVSIDAILLAIQQLPDQYRIVFNLYQLDGFTHKEIASMLAIHEGTSKSNYHRAKALLRKSLAKEQMSTNKKTSNYGA